MANDAQAINVAAGPQGRRRRLWPFGPVKKQTIAPMDVQEKKLLMVIYDIHEKGVMRIYNKHGVIFLMFRLSLYWEIKSPIQVTI